MEEIRLIEDAFVAADGPEFGRILVKRVLRDRKDEKARLARYSNRVCKFRLSRSACTRSVPVPEMGDVSDALWEKKRKQRLHMSHYADRMKIVNRPIRRNERPARDGPTAAFSSVTSTGEDKGAPKKGIGTDSPLRVNFPARGAEFIWARPLPFLPRLPALPPRPGGTVPNGGTRK